MILDMMDFGIIVQNVKCNITRTGYYNTVLSTISTKQELFRETIKGGKHGIQTTN